MPEAKQPTADEKMAAIHDAFDKMNARLDDMCKRMDAMLAKRAAKKDAKGGADMEDQPEEMAADNDPGGEVRDKIPEWAKGKTDVDEENERGEAQQRADAVAMSWGLRADRPLWGEPTLKYRIRQANRFKRYSPEFKNADLRLVSDRATFEAAEKRIYADAVAASTSNEYQAPGVLREVRRPDQSGRMISEFYGPVSVTLAPFRSPVYRVKRINKNPGEYW
jgi:colicin import membrane protein